MSHKYTRFCSSEVLMRHISLPLKDQQATHILTSVFKKPLAWLEQKYDRQMLLFAISKLTLSRRPSPGLVWLYVIEGGFWYHEMAFGVGEWARLAHLQSGHLRFGEGSVFAVLEEEAMGAVREESERREKEKILRFLKSHVFYPSYLEEQLLREFAMVLRVKALPYGKPFAWKDEDGSCKLAVVYRGVVSIEYQWKRNVQIAQVTRGMFLTNHYIKDEIEELDDLSLDPLRDAAHHPFPKFRFISKAEDTVLLAFNARLVSESPYNVNPELKGHIKRQFEKYSAKLESIIGFEEFNRLHRNRKSIKEELRRRREKETIQTEVTLGLMDHQRLSPILQTFSQLPAPDDLPEPPRPYSHAATLSPPRRLPRSHTSPVEGHSRSTLIHNTWVQEMTRKRKNVKSFSTLKNLSSLRSERQKSHCSVQEEGEEKERAFFVPNQFVKRKLKLKYEGLISKIKNFDLTTTSAREETLADKMKRLEEYIDSRRIVRLNSVKNKHKLLRDKVQY